MPKRLVLILFVLFLFLAAGGFKKASAAILFIDPAQKSLAMSETLDIQIKVNTQGETISFVVANLTFSKDVATLTRVEKNTALTLVWFDTSETSSSIEISNNSGEISLIPGIASPGANGDAVLLATLHFTLKAAGAANVNFSNSAVYRLADSVNIFTSSTNGAYTILSADQPTPTGTLTPAPTPTITSILPTPTVAYVLTPSPTRRLPSGADTQGTALLFLMAALLTSGGIFLLYSTKAEKIA